MGAPRASRRGPSRTTRSGRLVKPAPMPSQSAGGMSRPLGASPRPPARDGRAPSRPRPRRGRRGVGEHGDRSRGRSPSDGRWTTATRSPSDSQRRPSSRAMSWSRPAAMPNPRGVGQPPRLARARAAPRTRCAGCGGTCRRAHLNEAVAPRRPSGARSARAWSGCTRRTRSRRGCVSSSRRTTFWESPARGGSTTTTSGRGRALGQRPQRVAHVAREEVDVVDLVQARVLDRVGDRLVHDVERPHLAGAQREQG